MAAENSSPKVSNTCKRTEKEAAILSMLCSTRTVSVKRAGIIADHTRSAKQTRHGESLHPAVPRAGPMIKIAAAKQSSAVPIKNVADKKYTNTAVQELANSMKDVISKANAAIAHAIDNNDMSSLDEIVSINRSIIDNSFRGTTHVVRMILNKNVDMVKKYDNGPNIKNHMYKLRVAVGIGCIDIVKYYFYIYPNQCMRHCGANIFRRAIHDGQVEIAEWFYSLGLRINSLELPAYAHTTAEIKKWMDSKNDLIVTDALMPVLQQAD